MPSNFNRDKWIGFWIDDANGNRFGWCFAPQSQYGEVIATMKEDTSIDLIGEAVGAEYPWGGLQVPHHTALICRTIMIKTDNNGESAK